MRSTDRQAWKRNFCYSSVWAKVWKLVGCGTLILVPLFYVSLFLHISTFVTKTAGCVALRTTLCDAKTKQNKNRTNYQNTRRKAFEQVFVRTFPFYPFTQNSFNPLKPTTTEMSLAAAACLLFALLSVNWLGAHASSWAGQSFYTFFEKTFSILPSKDVFLMV